MPAPLLDVAAAPLALVLDADPVALAVPDNVTTLPELLSDVFAVPVLVVFVPLPLPLAVALNFSNPAVTVAGKNATSVPFNVAVSTPGKFAAAPPIDSVQTALLAPLV